MKERFEYLFGIVTWCNAMQAHPLKLFILSKRSCYSLNAVHASFELWDPSDPKVHEALFHLNAIFEHKSLLPLLPLVLSSTTTLRLLPRLPAPRQSWHTLHSRRPDTTALPFSHNPRS